MKGPDDGEANTAIGRPRSGLRTVMPARFAFCCITLFALVSWLPEQLFSPLNRHTAGVSAEILRFIGIETVLNATVLTNGQLSVDVITECSPLYLWILFGSLVATYPAPARRKIAGLVLWIPLLHLANILRIVLIFRAGIRTPRFFDLAHVYLGQVVMVLMLLAACTVWIRSVESRPAYRGGATFTARCIAWSALPFIAWVLYNRDYVMITDLIVRWIFELSGNTLEIPYSHTLYFQTFNLVTISGILLAGREKLSGKRVPMLLAAVTAVVSLHLLIRICNVLITAFDSSAAISISTAATVVGQYLIPVLCWMLLMRAGSMERKQPVPK